MVRFTKRGLFALLPAALLLLAFGAAPAAPDVGLQNVNLACNDGTNLNLALDATGLTALTSAVNAITLNPAGNPALTCGVSPQATSTSKTTSSSSSGSGGAHDFAVGGGQILIQCSLGVAHDNFSLSAHVPTGTPAIKGTPQPGAGGTFNTTFSQADSAACPEFGLSSGHLVAKVDCVQVQPGSPPGLAEITAQVTQSDGFYAPDFPKGTEIYIPAYDSGTNNGDMIQAYFVDSGQPCDFETQFPPEPIQHGNITVHSGA